MNSPHRAAPEVPALPERSSSLPVREQMLGVGDDKSASDSIGLWSW
jgi:hypothetical protein